MKNSIQPFIQRKVIVLHEDATAQQAARAMNQHRIGCVVVSDHKGHVVGVVTDRDIASEGISRFENPTKVPLSEIMTVNPIVVHETEDLERVISLMESNGIRRVPVVKELKGDAVRCVGLISVDDLIAAKAIDLDRLSRIVSSQLRRKVIPLRGGPGPRVELHNFYQRLAAKLVPKLEFTQPQLEQLTNLVLGALARRFHQTSALHFIASLPTSLQASLFTLAPGPDESIDLRWLTNEVSRVFNVDDATAYAVLVRFGSALEEWCEPQTLHHLKAQLPRDLLGIFSVEGKPKRKAA